MIRRIEKQISTSYTFTSQAHLQNEGYILNTSFTLG